MQHVGIQTQQTIKALATEESDEKTQWLFGFSQKIYS